MKKSTGLAAALLCILLPICGSACLHAQGSAPAAVDPSLPIIAVYKDQSAATTAREKNYGVQYKAHSHRAGVTGLHLRDGADYRKVLRHLKGDKNVAFAEPNRILHHLDIAAPNDPLYSSQYAPQIVDAPDAWALAGNLSGVTIAIIDTGTDATDADLSSHTLPGIADVAWPPGAVQSAATVDKIGHGTHVSGIAAASANNAAGIVGIAPGVTILPIKVFSDDDNATDLAAAQALHDAADNGCRVINLSLGAPGASATLQSAINYAWTKGCVIVAAAGNDGSNEVFYPADATNVIAVSASDSKDNIAGYSNFGSAITVAAPGDNIISTLPGNTYGYDSGTSMASPCVGGIAALCFAYSPSSTNAEIVSAIEGGADKVGAVAYVAGRNDRYGYGRVNAYRALIALKAPTPTKTTINDNAPSFTYSGAWSISTGRGYGDLNRDVHYCKANGASVSIAFTGTGLQLLSETYSDEGTAQVFLDGTLVQTINCASVTRVPQQVVFSALGLRSGAHILKVVKQTGQYLVVDGCIAYS